MSYADEISEKHVGFTEEQIEEVAHVITDRYKEEIGVNRLKLDDGPYKSVKIVIDGIDDNFPIYADPERKLSRVWGVTSDDEGNLPPEECQVYNKD